jgi:hypothetical protein
MRCAVCGVNYGLTHQCSEVAAEVAPEEAAPPPTGFAPDYYLTLAFNIARLDVVAIRRAARDPNATYYGAGVWMLTASVILVGRLLPRAVALARTSGPASLIAVIVGLSFGLVVMAIGTFLQLGLCHVLAKWLFGGSGTYLEVMRPLLLGWWVNCLTLVPVVGPIAAGLAWMILLMIVFEEADGIERLQALGISVGISGAASLLQLLLSSG